MQSSHTQFTDLGQGAWAVFRVATQSGSVYLVGLHSVGGRRSVVVRGDVGTHNENVIVRDTEPRIGEQSLYLVPSSDWVGQRLRVATMETSPIVSVTVVSDARTVGAVTGVMTRAPASGSGQAIGETSYGTRIDVDTVEREPAFPESHVRYAEDAASLLRAVERRGAQLFTAVEGEPQLRARLQVALAGCLLALEQLRGRGAGR